MRLVPILLAIVLVFILAFDYLRGTRPIPAKIDRSQVNQEAL